MFKMFNHQPSNAPQLRKERSVAQEMRDKAIETLRTGIQNQQNPLKKGIKEAEALITLLKEKLSLEGHTWLETDIAEAETCKAELERDFDLQSEHLARKRAA